MIPLTRRNFCYQFMLAGLTPHFATLLQAAEPLPRRIVLRSSWQVVNIGDIAHTPGVLALLEKYLPETEVTLWASGDLSPEVESIETRRFPRLKVVKGKINPDGSCSNRQLHNALNACDFLLHGSGPSFVAAADVTAFVKHFRRPFGVYGITFGGASPSVIDLLSKARFVFFRDTVSLEKARADGVSSPVMEFAPDGAFAVDLRQDTAAEKYLEAHSLNAGDFVCCIPRLRYTPYWLIKSGRQLDEQKAARNQEMAEHDHNYLRQAICAVVRETGKKVLLCPEDTTQMQVAHDHILAQLPAEVRKNVVWREQFWLTDEALSTYIRSAGLFGLEMHSPIMCIGNGVPAIVGRFAEQTSKGFMWKDIGLQDWLFDFDDPQAMEHFVPAVLKMINDPQTAQNKVQAARRLVQQRQSETMDILRGQLARID